MPLSRPVSVVEPVPPYATESDDEADTRPFTAWSGPVRVPIYVLPLVVKLPVVVAFVAVAEERVSPPRMVEEALTRIPPPPFGVITEPVEVAHFE